MKNNKGITLIALVITIIVLLILAGISIAMLTGDNGVLSKARQAKADNELGRAKDIVSLDAYEAIMEYYEETYVESDTAEYSGTELQAKIVEKIGASVVTPVTLTPTEDGVTLTYNERTVTATVDNDGLLTWSAITDVV